MARWMPFLVVIFSTTKKVVKHEEPGKEGGVEEGREGERAGRREGIPILSLVPYNSFSFLYRNVFVRFCKYHILKH